MYRPLGSLILMLGAAWFLAKEAMSRLSSSGHHFTHEGRESDGFAPLVAFGVGG